MKKLLLKMSLVPMVIAMPAMAGDSKAELQQQLDSLQKRLAQLEENSGKVKSDDAPLNFNVYGTLRPTFGLTSTGDDDVWDVGDALSRVGFATHKDLGNGLTGFAKGEFKVNIQANGDFGEARKAYVGIKGDFGRFTIGKQASTQYNLIADPVDIFNRASTPLAYDSASPFRTNNLVTFKKSIGNFNFSIDSQFNGEDGDDTSDMFNTGLGYSKDGTRFAIAYYTKELLDPNDGSETDGQEKTLGVSVAKSFGDLYLAGSYQDRDVDGVDGSTLDLVASYALSSAYTLKLGVSDFDDGVDSTASGSYNAYNTTIEWQSNPDFRLFAEYQKIAYDERDDTDSFMIGMRYNFDYQF